MGQWRRQRRLPSYFSKSASAWTIKILSGDLRIKKARTCIRGLMWCVRSGEEAVKQLSLWEFQDANDKMKVLLQISRSLSLEISLACHTETCSSEVFPAASCLLMLSVGSRKADLILACDMCRALILSKKVSPRAFAETTKKGQEAGEVGIEGLTIENPAEVSLIKLYSAFLYFMVYRLMGYSCS